MPRFAPIACLVLWILYLTEASPRACCQDQNETPAAASTRQDEKLWAEQYLKDDPLASKTNVTLEDLRQSIGDPVRQDTVLPRHFGRLEGSNESEKYLFLTELLTHPSAVVRGQAALELQNQGWLERLVRERLLSLLESNETEDRDAAIIALAELWPLPSDIPDTFWPTILAAYQSEDSEVRDAAMRLLRNEGPALAPLLLEKLSDERPEVRQRAARLLAEIAKPVPGAAAPEPRSDAIMEPSSPTMGGETIAKSRSVPPPPQTAREPTSGDPTSVRVYYGTNRERLLEPRRSRAALNWLIPAFAAAFLLSGGFAYRVFTTESRRGCMTWVVMVVGVATIAILGDMLRVEIVQMQSKAIGPQFGPRRPADAAVHYGFCDVSIPPSHLVGELEAPWIGEESEREHVVLQRVDVLEKEAYFDRLRSELTKLSSTERSCFVFIHGFNVSFDDAARRTAQIHHDLHFPGVPIFFSWPSRGSVHHYFSDRNEIGYSQFVIKEFLLDIADRIEADRIHVIAHSMGADATCRAIADMGDRGKLFDQIILAAPDIDREVFRDQLLPRMKNNANRMTLYCSKNDLALHISNTFNDASRAGDSRPGPLVVPDIDTIDASGIDTALLGHSYYGDCVPIIDDVRLMILQRLPPMDRRLKPWPYSEALRYWTFQLESGDGSSM